MSRWRNGLAHWTSNSKVAGSSPARDGIFLSFFFFFFPLQANCASFRVPSMWTRLLSRWRICGLFSCRSYSCKKISNEVLGIPVSKLLKIHQQNKSISGFMNCALQLQDCSREEMFALPFHSSLQEHLSVAGLLWFKQSFKSFDLNLPGHLEIVSYLDPSRFEIHKEEPTESLDNKRDMWKGKQCGSVLKKRRSKMNKHKYKKRRKKFKFLRRKLGKWILGSKSCVYTVNYEINVIFICAL